MFNTYIHNYVDAVQNGKKEFVKNTVKQEKLASIINEFVDAQTQYTKSYVDASINSLTSLNLLMMNKDFYNFDWLVSNKKAK